MTFTCGEAARAAPAAIPTDAFPNATGLDITETMAASVLANAPPAMEDEFEDSNSLLVIVFSGEMFSFISTFSSGGICSALC